MKTLSTTQIQMLLTGLTVMNADGRFKETVEGQKLEAELMDAIDQLENELIKRGAEDIDHFDDDKHWDAH